MVGVKTRRMENMVENDIFYCLVQERKQERQKMERKIFLLAHIFLSSQFGRKMRRKECWMMYFTQIPSLHSSHLPFTLFILFNEYKFVDHVFAAHVFVAQKEKGKKRAMLLPKEERRKKKKCNLNWGYLCKMHLSALFPPHFPPKLGG